MGLLKRRRCVAVVAAVLVSVLVSLMAPLPAMAQEDYQILKAFEGAIEPLGGLVRATDGNLYGGTEGQFFRILPDGTYVELRADLGFWWDPIQGSDGFIYSGDSSKILRLSLSGDSSVLYALNGTGGQLAGPVVTGPDGALYGVKRLHGDLRLGTIYRLSLDGTITTVHSFTAAEGDGTYTRLIKGADGNFYGNLAFSNVIFRMTPAGDMTTLHRFSGGLGGSQPMAAPFEDADGTLYGTTERGGEYGYGVVYSLRPDGTFRVLHSFNGPGGDGHEVRTSLTSGSDDLLYGTTSYTIFSITRDGSFRVLHRALGSVEARRYGWRLPTPLQSSDGNLYGTFRFAGPHNGGVYRLNTQRSPCINLLDLRYLTASPPFLRITQFMKAEAPAFWGAWLAVNGQVTNTLWAAVVPPITPTIGFEFDIPNFPPGLQVDVFSLVITASLNVCSDLKTIQTGELAAGAGAGPSPPPK